MEKHRCKLCSKSFSNGRVLGGHMKSHMVASRPTRKRRAESLHESSTSSSSSSFADPDGKSPSYRLRENPRKSFRVADPGFSFANLDSGSSSVVVVDARDEVESEPQTGIPVRKRVRKSGGETRRQRSKKTKKKATTKTGRKSEELKKKKKKKKAGRHSNGSTTESPEPASSVSDTSPEEDLAMCLIMLSRDAGKRETKLKKRVFEESEEAEEEMKAGKRQCLELRRCLIDLNLPPPAEDDEAWSVVGRRVGWRD